ncbi:MAG: cell wall-associated NlpC family hydrolase [Desulforhopalus sp.]
MSRPAKNFVGEKSGLTLKGEGYMTTIATINVGVSSHYRKDSYNSEMTTQGVLGEEVEVIDHQPLFSRIVQSDGYKSWMSTDQLSFLVQKTVEKTLVTAHFVDIYEGPSIISKRLRDGVIGCKLAIVDEQNNWYQILLPDNSRGWVAQNVTGSLKGFTATNLIQQARDFLGYQYTWGGTTPKGFDCSGLIQTVFTLCSCPLPRDSHEQQQQNLVSNDYQDARPGDLLFFGKTKDRATHVALSIGDNRFIHASGWVKENSLNPKDSDFSQHHVNTFISINRYLPGYIS